MQFKFLIQLESYSLRYFFCFVFFGHWVFLPGEGLLTVFRFGSFVDPCGPFVDLLFVLGIVKLF